MNPYCCSALILAGGDNHTFYSENISAEQIEDFAEMAGIEYVRIGASTTVSQFRYVLK